jgi:hypothetical protein
MAERDPWRWTEGEHWHQRDTNGDRYRCPLAGCWWNAGRPAEAPGGTLDPRWAWMRKLLAEQGPRGYRPARLVVLLDRDGMPAPEKKVRLWLAADERAGLAYKVSRGWWAAGGTPR